MMNLSESDKKLIEKYKKKVHKQYPGAYLSAVHNGYTIVQETEDLQLKDILSEFFIPPAKTPAKAWEYAQSNARIFQNLNRTHPLRIEGMEMEDKLARIEARKNRRDERPTKSSKFDIY
jgi:hypothetical protein